MTLRQKGHFLRVAGIGLGVSAGLIGLSASINTTTYGDLVAKTLLGVMLAPSILIGSVVGGLFPEAIIYVGGYLTYFNYAYKRLSRRTVVAQLSAQAP